MFVDIDLKPYIQALLDKPPKPQSGFISQMNADDLRFFITGNDTAVSSGPPLILKHGLAPVAWVRTEEIQKVLEQLEAEGKVRPTCVTPKGQCYAWERPDHYLSHYTPWQRFKLRRKRRKTVRKLERLAQQGEQILSGHK